MLNYTPPWSKFDESAIANVCTDIEIVLPEHRPFLTALLQRQMPSQLLSRALGDPLEGSAEACMGCWGRGILSSLCARVPVQHTWWVCSIHQCSIICVWGHCCFWSKLLFQHFITQQPNIHILIKMLQAVLAQHCWKIRGNSTRCSWSWMFVWVRCGMLNMRPWWPLCSQANKLAHNFKQF